MLLLILGFLMRLRKQERDRAGQVQMAQANNPLAEAQES